DDPGFGIRQYAAAESDHPPLHIDDCKQETVPEPIVVTGARLARCDEPDFGCRYRRNALLGEEVGEAVPTGRCIPDAECLQRVSNAGLDPSIDLAPCGSETAPEELLLREARGGVLAKLRFEPVRSQLVRRV